MKNAFAAPDCYKLTGVSDPELFLHLVKILPEDEALLEELLVAKYTWFPYRRLAWFERTYHFVQCFNLVSSSLVNYRASMDPTLQDVFKQRKSILKRDERIAPWAKNEGHTLGTSPRWKQWVRARRSADKRGMIYEDFIAAGFMSTMMRGWAHPPQPSHLACDKLLDKVDEFHDATIPAIVAKKYAVQMQMTQEPYFLAAAYEGGDLQNEYFAYLAREVVRANPAVSGMRNLKAERVWEGFQQEGRVPSCVAFSSMLHSQSALTT